MAVSAYQMDGMIPVPRRGFNPAQNRANKFAQAEYGYKGPSRSGQQRNLDTQMLGIDMSSNRLKQTPANYAEIDAATFGALGSGNASSLRTGSPYKNAVITDRLFGDHRTMMNSAIQNAMTKMRLGVQRSDLAADTAMTLGDIGRYAAIFFWGTASLAFTSWNDRRNICSYIHLAKSIRVRPSHRFPGPLGSS